MVKVASAIQSVQLASDSLLNLQSCKHSEFICPGGWLLDGTEFVENMFCSYCDARVDTDIASCREVCETCEIPLNCC